MSHQPDEVVATDAGGGFDPHSEGQYPVLCVDVVNLGVNVEQFADQDPREVAKVALVFASGERQEDGDKELRIVTVEMTLSANEKANLRKFLESWRGRTYTAEQAEAGLPITKLYGKPGLVSIEHVRTKRGRLFAKVTSIAPLPRAIPEPDKALLAAYARPKFLTDKKAQYAAALAKHRGLTGDDIPTPQEPQGDDDDPLPF